MIDKFYELLTKLGVEKGHDKILHALVGFFLGLLGHYLFIDSILMIAPVVIGAVGKELYDKYIKKTEFDFFDMFATLVGGVAGIFLYGAIGV